MRTPPGGPELTVVIPTKDRPGLLVRAVDSVLCQPGDIEVIVVDDGSATDAAAAAQRLTSSRPRLKVIRSASSEGAPSARTRGLEAATGRYWATLDDDDEWLPGKWEVQRAALERVGSPGDVVVLSGILPVTREGEQAPVLSPTGELFRCSGLQELFERIRVRAFLNTYVVPTALLRAVGGYDPRLIWGEHTDVLIRLSDVARFVGVDHVGVRVHRAHEADETRVGRDGSRRAEGIALLLEKHARAFAAAPTVRARYEDVLGVTLLRLGRRDQAIRTFSRTVGCRGAGVRRLRALGRILAAAAGAGTGQGTRARRRMQEPAA